MLEQLDGFRRIISDAMLSCIDKRVVLYGYGYTGRFLKWYAKYYHGINVDYVITEDWSSGVPYDQELFRSTLFGFGYKDVNDCVVWLAVPYSKKVGETIEKSAITKENIVDFYRLVYGDDIDWPNIKTDPFNQRKTGRRDIQFLEYLEWKYDCNFVTRINTDCFSDIKEGLGAAFSANTQKEIFEIMDNIHYCPNENDAIIDIGCGKGGAMLSFLDYGFKKVGGIEYESGLYDVLTDNLTQLNLHNSEKIRTIHGDAALINKELDDYNWFYMFSPFYGDIFKSCIDNIKRSIERYPRNVRIIYVFPHEYRIIEESGAFRLCNQFTFTSKQRIVKVYESI